MDRDAWTDKYIRDPFCLGEPPSLVNTPRLGEPPSLYDMQEAKEIVLLLVSTQ